LELVLEAATGSKPYEVFNPKNTQRMVYAKGKPVYELVDPDGNVYVLQAHEERLPIEGCGRPRHSGFSRSVCSKVNRAQDAVQNRKTATVLGLDVPPSIMLRADEVIE
jgi:hypothetical protein